MARFPGPLANQQIISETTAVPDQGQIAPKNNQVMPQSYPISGGVETTNTQAQLERMFGETAPAPQRMPAEQDYMGSGIIEPARAIVSGAGRQALGGLAGLGYTAGTGDLEGGVKIIEDVQAGAFQPKTESGQRNLQKLGDLMEMGVDVARIPLSSIAGISELVTGQGMEQAQQTVGNVQERGFEAVGERVLEETGSPLLATLAEVSPDIVGSLIAIKGVQATPRVRPTTPTKNKIAEKLREGSNDPIVAKYKLTEEPTKKIGNY